MLSTKTSEAVFEISRRVNKVTDRLDKIVTYVNDHFLKLYKKQDALEQKADAALEGIIDLDARLAHQEAQISELKEMIAYQTKTIESLSFRLARTV
ncbi:hypothetical protein ACSQ5K_26650 [Pseudomonas sp. PhalM4]